MDNIYISTYPLSSVEVVGPWCGLKDECSQVGLILPLFDELTWPRWLR